LEGVTAYRVEQTTLKEEATMKSRWFALEVFSLLSFLFCALALADDIPTNVSFSTRAITPFAIEGLTMDATGNFYTTGRQTDFTKKCPVWRISQSGTRVTVGFIPNQGPFDGVAPSTPPTTAPCNPSGLTFDSVGNLYVADAATIKGVSGFIWKVTPNATGCASDDSTDPACAKIVASTASSPSVPFASAVPGANGLAFDRDDNLWTGDGVTGLGRVWKITGPGANCDPSALLNCTEAFRIQAMANDINATAPTTPPTSVPNVGSDRRGVPGGTIGTVIVTGTSITFRTATNTLNSQAIVANGVAFNNAGDLFVADTARGAIWKVEFDSKGNIKSQMGCDTTFPANTLCLNNIFVQHALLEGTDGIALDNKGNIWNDANERNAVVVVSNNGEVIEVFRNPVNSSGLRNSADTAQGNTTILEFPTSPFLLGKQFCTSMSDLNRRDNSPSSLGEINSGGPVGARGKISCMDQDLKVPGLKLPVH
jgi:SMP-30/Gluconolactonase/LRE-like region